MWAESYFAMKREKDMKCGGLILPHGNIPLFCNRRKKKMTSLQPICEGHRRARSLNEVVNFSSTSAKQESGWIQKSWMDDTLQTQFKQFSSFNLIRRSLLSTIAVVPMKTLLWNRKCADAQFFGRSVGLLVCMHLVIRAPRSLGYSCSSIIAAASQCICKGHRTSTTCPRPSQLGFDDLPWEKNLRN